MQQLNTPIVTFRAFLLRSSISLAAASLLPAVGLGGCAPSRDVGNKTIVIGTTEDFESINELIAQGSSFNTAIVNRVLLKLLEEQADSQESPASFLGRLASSWAFSEDRLQLVFRIREDAVWSDGVPVSAEDVRYTWQAHISPEVGWDYAFVKEAITDVEVVDPKTVRFHFSAASSTQLEDANEGVILPRHVWSELPFSEWRQQPHWFLDHTPASGPFLLESWQPQQSVVLVRNPSYFEVGLPKADRCIFRFIAEPSNLLGHLLGGEVDVINHVRPADAQKVIDHPDFELIPYQTRQFTFVSWNTLRPQFQDPEVRRALALGVDRQTIVDTLWFDYAKLGLSPIPSNFWAHNTQIEPWPYDPAEARRVLTEKGWIDTNRNGIRDKDGVEFEFELTTSPGDPVRWDAIQMIQAQLREVGVEVAVRRIEFKALNALNLDHNYDATLASLMVDTTLNLGCCFHSRAIDQNYNYGSYSNPEVDLLIEQVSAKLDPFEAESLLHRLQSIIHQEQPMLFLWEPTRLVAVRSEVNDVEPNMLSIYFNLREWSKEGSPVDDRLE